LFSGQRCTRVENPVGVAEVFTIIPGVKAFRNNWHGGLPILGFISFLLTSFLKICVGCADSYPSPLCASMLGVFVIGLTKENSFQNDLHKNKKIS
jgi:hypothetical protein